MKNNEKILYCLECNEVFTKKEYENNNENCPICNANPFEIWDWKDFLKDNPTLPEKPEKNKKYDIHKIY